MGILENELVRKYFGCDGVHPGYNKDHTSISCKALVAYKVLLAMEEPIRKGDEFLYVIPSNCSIILCTMQYENLADWETFHPTKLRLPSQYQTTKPEKIEMKCSCGFTFTHDCKDQPPPVTEKVTGIVRNYCQVGSSCNGVNCSCRCHQPPAPTQYAPCGQPMNHARGCDCNLKPVLEKCNHSGFKRYCGDAIYCEQCKIDIATDSEKWGDCSCQTGPGNVCNVIHRKPVDSGKCICNPCRCGGGFLNVGCPVCNRDQAVAEKIKELKNCLTPHYSWTGDTEKELRELVDLARTR